MGMGGRASIIESMLCRASYCVLASRCMYGTALRVLSLRRLVHRKPSFPWHSNFRGIAVLVLSLVAGM